MASYLETLVRKSVVSQSNHQSASALFLSACNVVSFALLLNSLHPVYDVSGAASDRNCVVLSDIHIDIMDYIQPASCTDAEFRQMWAEFEWENKVSPGSVADSHWLYTARPN